jgi:hypothetical protein
MIIIAKYSHAKGEQFIRKRHEKELAEIEDIINSINASQFKTKISQEKTMKGDKLYNPPEINNEFTRLFTQRNWEKVRIDTETKIPEIGEIHKGYREMDFVKNNLGVEVQFGKYAFQMYNVLAKMTIFAKQGIIDSGVEIVPMHGMTGEMSTGIGSFEQMKTDLELRGESNIDVPTLILGIDDEKRIKTRQLKIV